jgi:hypothetical protein
MKGSILPALPEGSRQAVAHYWQTRRTQIKKQQEVGKADQGRRSAVTGAAQMDGFIDLFTEIIINAGISEQYVFLCTGR